MSAADGGWLQWGCGRGKHARCLVVGILIASLAQLLWLRRCRCGRRGVEHRSPGQNRADHVAGPNGEGIGPMNRRRTGWITAAAILVAVGTTGSVLGAQMVARNDGRDSREAFVASSNQIASTLKLSIEHEKDLVVIAGAFAVRNPNGSQASFIQWTNSVGAFARYPELQGIAELAMVPAS
jgi:hypothetical protein